MKKICFYCDSIFSFGGVQRVLAVIARSLSADYNITILTNDNIEDEDRSMYELNQTNIQFRYINLKKTNYLEYIPCKIYSYAYKKKYLPQNAITSKWYGYSSFSHSLRKKLIAELNFEDYDCIIGVHAFISLKLASIRHLLKAKKVVGWMHSSFEAFFNTPGFYLYEQKEQFRYEMPKLDGIIVLSNCDKEKYEQELQLFPKVIYNPLSLSPKGKGNPSYKKFISIGRMSYLTKGFDILIEAFALFAKHNNEWTLNIVGEGPEEEMLIELINKHRMENRITISPFTKDIQQYYSTSSIFILSSRWEGFPLVLAEAMSHKLPIISSDLPIIKELLDGHNNHYLFKNGEKEQLAIAMNKMATLEEEQLTLMGEVSLKIAESLKLPVIINEWKKYLDLD